MHIRRMHISLIEAKRHLLVLFVAAIVLAGCTGASAPLAGVSTPAPPSANLPTDTPLIPQTPTQPTIRLFPTLAPLTKSAILSCPVSLPHVSKSPAEHYVSTIDGFQNDDGTLFTLLWPGGKVLFSPRGPEHISPDGSLGMKWPWYRMIPGEVIIDGRRLDAAAPPMPMVILKGEPDGYGETGFHPSGLIFPTEGCWEVTARVGNNSLTFVTLVVKVPFEFLQPNWLPEGMIYKDVEMNAFPESLRLIFGSSIGDRGEVSIKTTQGSFDDSASYPETAKQPITVHGQPGVCVQGGWDQQGEWQDEADVGALEWNAGGLRYQISHTELGLLCEDLLRIAGSPL